MPFTVLKQIIYAVLIKDTKYQGHARRVIAGLCAGITWVLFFVVQSLEVGDNKNRETRQLYNVIAQAIYVFYISMNLDFPYMTSILNRWDLWLEDTFLKGDASGW